MDFAQKLIDAQTWKIEQDFKRYQEIKSNLQRRLVIFMANYENISRNRDLPILIKEYEDFSRELLNQNAFLKWLESISALDCVRSMETVKSFKYENDMNLEILKRIEGLKWNQTDNKESEELVYFKNNSKIVTKINVLTLKKQEIEIVLSDNIDMRISTCKTPENSLFCVSNSKTQPRLSFILDSNQTVTVTRPCPPHYASGCICFKDSVYVFGGYNRHDYSTNKAYVYSLSKNYWKKIRKMPQSIGNIQCLLLGQSIVLKGQEYKHPIIYDIFADSYSDINLSIDNSCVLLQRNGIGYIIENENTVFQSKKNDVFNWKSLNIPVSYKDNIISSGIFNQNSFYFVADSRFVYEFDLKNKTFKEAKRH